METSTREQRIGNYRLNAYECAAQATVLRSFPVNVLLHTGTSCNFRCIFCTDRSNGQNDEAGDLSFEQFLAHTAPLSKALTVNLYGWCEPLVNPDYPGMYDYVTKKHDGIVLSIVTNGSLLSDRWARKLVSYKWARLAVSLNATKASTHRTLSGSDQFEHIIGNLRKVIELRRAEDGNSPHISLSFVAMARNIEELPGFVELAADLGADAVVIQNLIILRKEHEQYSLTHRQDVARRMYRTAKTKALERGIGFSAFSLASYLLDESEHGGPSFCRDPWESFWVKASGDVCMCCYSNTIMGNLERQSLERIWNGEHYQYYRRYVNSNRLPESCKRCPKKLWGASLNGAEGNRG